MRKRSSIPHEGQLLLQARLTIPTYFVGLVGIDDMTARLVAEATRKQLNLEVVMVLDNSISMNSYGRMSALQTAATCATNIIFYGACTPAAGAEKNTKVKIGVVPFTWSVNVGSGYKTSSWVDTTGLSSISNDNFDDDDNDSNTFAGTVNRFDLYDNLVSEPWRGCFESRPYPNDVLDTVPTSTNPDTLFVPYFAPDEPDGYTNSYINDDPSACYSGGGGYNCFCYKWSKWWVDGGQLCYELDDSWNTISSGTNVCECDSWYANNGGSHYYGSMKSYYCPASSGSVASGLSDRELQERLCKYDGANPSYYGNRGPNAECAYVPLLPLTDNPTSVISRINAMYPEGGTNIQNGTMWGFYAISPTEPLTEGADYGTATSKVMILMTDGYNNYPRNYNMNGTSYYMSYGYLYNGRMGSMSDDKSTLQQEMDDLTLETCAAAKAEGIQIYTIGLSPENNDVIDMLTECASSEAKAYFPANPSDLNGVFTEIAEQLSVLRLAQ